MTTISTISGPQSPNARPTDNGPIEYKQTSDDRSVVVSQFEKLLASFQGADVEQIMETLAQLHELTSTLQGNVSTQRIQTADMDRKEATKKMMEMMQAVLDKIKEAQAALSDDKVLGWLGAVGEMLGAALLTAFVVYSIAVTGGASAPLVCLTGAMLVTATMAVANMAAKETGATTTNALGETHQANISFDGMVDDIVAQQIADGTIVVVRQDANGNYIQKDPKSGLDVIVTDPHKDAKPGAIFMTTDQLAKWKMGWGITANLIVAAVMLSMGFGGAEFAAKGASFGSKVASESQLATIGTLDTAGSVTQVLTSAVEAAQGIVQGTTGLKLAQIDKDTEEARTWKAFYEATVKDVTQRLSVILSNMQQIMTSVNENYKGVSQVIKDSTDTSADTNRRLSA